MGWTFFIIAAVFGLGCVYLEESQDGHHRHRAAARATAGTAAAIVFLTFAGGALWALVL